MAKNDNLQDLLQSVADAIRAKKGTTGTINAQDFDSEIASITGGGGGLGNNTKEVIKDISGVESTDDIVLSNAIAKAYADTPSEQKWNGTRSTADGGTIKDGVAFVESVKGSTMKLNQLYSFDYFTRNGISYTQIDGVLTITSSNTSGVGRIYKSIVCEARSYLYLARVKANSNAIYLGATTSKFTDAQHSGNGQWQTLAHISVYTSAGTKNPSIIDTRTSGWDAFQVKEIMLIDLTEMGLGSCTTASEVAQAMGYSSIEDIPYYEFTNGTKLLNFTHNTITSKDEDNATLDTLSLNVPSSVFPNGMMGVGNTYDEIRPAEGKVYLRFTSKDLGSVNWSYSTVGYFMSQSLFPNMSTSEIICLKYPVIPNTTDTTPHIIRIGSKRMYIKDDTFEGDATAFKASLNGVIAYYPLETPTEQTIAKSKAFYKVANGGTESVSGGTNSTPIKADIGYRGMSAEELVNAINI